MENKYDELIKLVQIWHDASFEVKAALVHARRDEIDVLLEHTVVWKLCEDHKKETNNA